MRAVCGRLLEHLGAIVGAMTVILVAGRDALPRRPDAAVARPADLECEPPRKVGTLSRGPPPA
jgi:hypothetical protein